MARLIHCLECGRNRRHEAHGLCAPCYQCQWYEEHREERLAYQTQWRIDNPGYNRQWRKDNPNREREQKCRYRQAHRVEERERKLRYYKAHADKVRNRRRKWLRANRARTREYKRRHRALKSGAATDLVDEAEIYERDGHMCLYCGATEDLTLDHLTLDHIIPLAKGGPHSEDNLIVACRSCNSSKGIKPLMEWLQTQPNALPWVM